MKTTRLRLIYGQIIKRTSSLRGSTWNNYKFDPHIQLSLTNHSKASRISTLPCSCADIVQHNHFATSTNLAYFSHQMAADKNRLGGMPTWHSRLAIDYQQLLLSTIHTQTHTHTHSLNSSPIHPTDILYDQYNKILLYHH